MAHDGVEVLQGGVGNAGAVLRIGDEVERPSNAHTTLIHGLLAHLRAAGFTAVPEVLRLDGDRERLRFIAGDVPTVPFPAWSQTDAVLASTAVLLRRFHEAAAEFEAPPGAMWSTELVDPEPGDEPVWCHNDVCPQNVVYREGGAVALLDFDFLAPGRVVWDLAALASMCVPIDTDGDAALTGRRGLDPFTRLRVVADGYGLTDQQRPELVDALAMRFAGRGEFVRRRVEAGEAAFIEMWEAMGGQERYDRRQEWFAVNRDRFLAVLSG